MEKKYYYGLDIGKLFFAVLIPFLHIGFPKTALVIAIRLFFSRLGVPFFFVVSGFLLKKSILEKGAKEALKSYELRIIKLLLLWLAIYFPLLLINENMSMEFIKELLFMTPAYLWYLTALVFAAIPFCLFKNRKILFVICSLIYFLGTFFSESYSWLSGGLPVYESLFITTRNGLFFALPFLCIGEIAFVIEESKSFVKLMIPFVISYVLYILEMLFLYNRVGESADLSMCFTLPFVSFFIVLLFLNIKSNTIPKCDIRRMSTAIYIMQFGLITISGIVMRKIDLLITVVPYFQYAFVILIPVLIIYFFNDKRLVKFIFG